MDYETFLALHKPQLETAGVPEHFWPTVHAKIGNDVFDAGQHFAMGYDPAESQWCIQVTGESTISASEADHIFLIDHAWTYDSIATAKAQLKQNPNLLVRMAQLVEYEVSQENGSGGMAEDADDEAKVVNLVDTVMDRLWLYVQQYRIATQEQSEQKPIWYVMDEFGCRLQHSDDPTFKMAPLLYGPEYIGYTLLWPLCDVEVDGEVTRDFAYAAKSPLSRAACLAPWYPERLLCMTESTPNCLDVGDDEAKEERCGESLPSALDQLQLSACPTHRPLKVFTDHELVREFLSDGRFSLVDNEDDADILWVSWHFKDFEGLEKRDRFTYVNQYPCENVLTCKDLLVKTSRRAVTRGISSAAQSTAAVARGTEVPDWLPESYDMVTELPQLISRFLAKQDSGDDEEGPNNLWICKPWNLGRSLDIHVANTMAQLVQLSHTGPKVASRYLTRPVLFSREGVGRVKFDYRYVVFLKSAQPLELYVYKVFWLRFANRPFRLQALEDYETHFTVMNYVEDGASLHQISCEEFVPMFNEQFPQTSWESVERDTFTAIKELFTAAVSGEAPSAVVPSVRSRALYALDLMVEWRGEGETQMRPQVLEVNFTPDCIRACKYHPQFYNHVFKTLFLDEAEECPVARLA